MYPSLIAASLPGSGEIFFQFINIQMSLAIPGWECDQVTTWQIYIEPNLATWEILNNAY